MNCFSSQENRTPHITKLPPMKVIWVLQKIYEAPDTILLAALLCLYIQLNSLQKILTYNRQETQTRLCLCIWNYFTTLIAYKRHLLICLDAQVTECVPSKRKLCQLHSTELKNGFYPNCNLVVVTVSLFVTVTFYCGNGTSEKYKHKKIKYLSTSM